MKTFSARILAGCEAPPLGATMASAQLATQNDTTVTFSAPVSLPGVTLPAGSYLFKLADSQVNRNVVQVFAQDRSKIFATILAIPAERTEPADETVITFKEAPAELCPGGSILVLSGRQARAGVRISEIPGCRDCERRTHVGALGRFRRGGHGRDEVCRDLTRRTRCDAAPSQTAQAAPATTPESSAQAAQPRAAETTTPAAPVTEQAAPAAPTAAAAPSTPAAAPSATASTRATSPAQPAQPSAVGTSGTAAALPKTASPIPLIGLLSARTRHASACARCDESVRNV